ncbi:UMF1 family MFS transporter [Parvibaculum indicum]|uniref:MFS transporter n=1 Tax=Parvibaculum indicum TaxID=562969 RepID=UPI001423B507|nr:UMF1 family MFS transporter [Parvibaculum indicum]
MSEIVEGAVPQWQPPHDTGGKEPASNWAQGAWVLYEWANQTYFSLITIFLFPPFFTNVLAATPIEGQAYWGYVQAIAGATIALMSPLLGAMADAAGPRKPWIVASMLMCAAGCFGLWFAIPGEPLFHVMVSLIVAAVGMEFAIIFANAMLPTIASDRRIGLLSGIGIGMGQLAAIAALILVLIFFQLPGEVSASFIPAEPLFGLSKAAHETDRIVGPISGAWFIVFMLPLLFLVPDQATRGLGRRAAAKAGLIRLWETLKSVRHFRNVGLYLLARMLFYDGMTAIFVFGGILAASIFQWGAMQMAIYGVWVTLFAALGGFVGGWVDLKIGSKRTLVWAIVGVVVFFAIILSFDRDRIFYFITVPVPEHAAAFSTLPQQLFLVMIALFGLMVGPVIASSRTMMARISPKEMMTEFFGLFALCGKATAWIAPLFIGIVTELTQNQRFGLMVAIPLILTGLVLLLFVKEERASAVVH